MTDRQRLHALIDDLPEPEVYTALRFAEDLHRDTLDPVAQALRDAPSDNEPLTGADLAEHDEAERDRQEGRVVSHDQARFELL